MILLRLIRFHEVYEWLDRVKGHHNFDVSNGTLLARRIISCEFPRALEHKLGVSLRAVRIIVLNHAHETRVGDDPVRLRVGCELYSLLLIHVELLVQRRVHAFESLLFVLLEAADVESL